MNIWQVNVRFVDFESILRPVSIGTTMKKYLYLISLCVLGFWNSSLAQITNTNTDAFGYRFATNLAPTAPAVYDWIDISATGTRVSGLGDDNVVGPIPMGIEFKYYWNPYTDVYVGSNGYIMFGDNALLAQGSAGMPNIPLNSDGKGNFIAGMLSDLTFISHATGQTLTGAKVMYQTIGTKFVITFDSVRFWNNIPAAGVDEATGLNTFQFVLDASNNGIQINYKNSEGPWFTGSSGVMTCGMENITGQLGLRWRRKTTAANAPPLMPAGSAVRVDYPASSTYSFKDVTAQAVFTRDNKGGTAFSSIPKTITAFVRNSGTVKVTTPVNARVIISDYNDNGVYNQTVVIDSMQANELRIIDFPVQLQPGDTAGLFKVTFTTTTTGDQWSANNSRLTKLVVLDSTQGSVDLKFTRANPGTLTDSRQGPNTGMVFDPPYQPMVISQISADLVWPDADGWASLNIPGVQDSLTKTRIEVYIGDGPGGAIGTLLDSFTIASETDFDATVIGEELSNGTLINKILRFKRTLPTPISWFNGARIYVGAIHNQATRFVWNSPYMEVYKAGFPASGRCLEITGGVWGENRGKDSMDVALGLIGDPLAVSVASMVKVAGISAYQNIPNPAVANTAIPFFLPESGKVRITLRDAMGREVKAVQMDGVKGRQTYQMDLKGIQPAIYYYTLSHESGSVTRKMIVK